MGVTRERVRQIIRNKIKYLFKSFYLYDKNYQFAKVALTLHKNTDEWGGGIDIVPKGHRFPICTGNKWIDFNVSNQKTIE